jgi:YegS/Rv2252/BmrU family lipid kinase
MSARRAAVVVNPSKVDDDPDVFRADLTDALKRAGWEEPLWLETTVDDPGANQAKEAVRQGVDLVLVHGGDGTVMWTVTGLAGNDIPLGLLPAGTGNLLARNLDLPQQLDEALDVALTGATRRVDVGDIGDRCFVVMAGMGFDAAMMEDAPEGLKKRLGWAAYVVSGAKHLTDRRMRVRLQLDDQAPQRVLARTVLVGNVGTLQGGIPLLPDAEPDDGVLDVAIVSPRGLGEWLSVAWRVVTRRRTRDHQLACYRARRVSIRTHHRHPRQLDGDPLEPGSELTVSVRPGALLLRVPQDDKTSDDSHIKELAA